MKIKMKMNYQEPFLIVVVAQQQCSVVRDEDDFDAFQLSVEVPFRESRRHAHATGTLPKAKVENHRVNSTRPQVQSLTC